MFWSVCPVSMNITVGIHSPETLWHVKARCSSTSCSPHEGLHPTGRPLGLGEGSISLPGTWVVSKLRLGLWIRFTHRFKACISYLYIYFVSLCKGSYLFQD